MRSVPQFSRMLLHPSVCKPPAVHFVDKRNEVFQQPVFSYQEKLSRICTNRMRKKDAKHPTNSTCHFFKGPYAQEGARFACFSSMPSAVKIRADEWEKTPDKKNPVTLLVREFSFPAPIGSIRRPTLRTDFGCRGWGSPRRPRARSSLHTRSMFP
jgi:hypothetical protein